MPSVEVFHPDGSTETIPGTVGWSDKRKIGHTRKLRIKVERSLAQSVSLTRKQDEIQLGNGYRGPLTDIETGGPSWTLIVRSPEWYATQEAPTFGGDRRQGNDQDLLTDLINEIPEWSVGNVASLTGPMTFVFNHSFANEAMRQIETNAPGELQWAGDGTVDYVENLGTDKSGSITLEESPGDGTAANLENGIQIKDKGRKFDATHLRVIGAHEGEAQFFAQLVPEDDPQTYEHEVRYTQPRWTDDSDTDWDRYESKDVMAQDTLEEEAAALADELVDEYVEATATVYDEDIDLGDFVRVVKPDADLDRTMRIHRITTKTKQDTTAATVDEVLLSTRTVAREGASDQARDIQVFNTGWQGSSVAVNVGPYRQGIDPTHPVTMPFRYPALEYENTAAVQVRGLEYRVDSQGAAAGGGTTVSASNQTDQITGLSNSPTFGADFTLSPGEDISITNSIGSSYGGDILAVVSDIQTDGSNHLLTAQLEVEGVGDGMDITAFTDTIGNFRFSDIITEADAFDDITLTVENPPSASTDITVEGTSGYTTYEPLHEHSVEFPDHTHPIEPGIFETNDTPSGVDLLINGSTVATDIGSGTFQTTVDVAGEFTPNDWNTLQLQSDSLGIVQATVFLEGYDQIGIN